MCFSSLYLQSPFHLFTPFRAKQLIGAFYLSLHVLVFTSLHSKQNYHGLLYHVMARARAEVTALSPSAVDDFQSSWFVRHCDNEFCWGPLFQFLICRFSCRFDFCWFSPRSLFYSHFILPSLSHLFPSL